ncbi:STE14 [Candida pseudojiufengensis]|uniref:STE14 n=1 Tax=Candida pseudojiufengensis TaxID=497109 RepID=UPI00222561AD|nr:STE14 [Candida pseudojiufengensis]KAI5962926.1 STE14 [Candida pseudojiufengensis]
MDPLSRYDPTRNNLLVISIKSFLIGIVFTLATILEFYNTSYTSIFLYLQFICLFHSLEFILTYIYNNSEIDDDSFILEDKELHFINIASIIEFLINPIKIHTIFGGVLLLIIGQFIRSYSMIIAKENFNHYIQKQTNKNHKLVDYGIYRYIRHPSYLGFFVWFIGLQLILGNIIILVVGSIILWKFFKDRIKFEEEYLIKFFGNDYVEYKNSTSTWMFIS